MANILSKTMYCVKCKTMVAVSNPSVETFKNNKRALKGKCPHCGTSTFQIVKNDYA